MSEAWEESGACRGHPTPDIFFAEEEESPTSPRTKEFRQKQAEDTAAAKAVCAACPVQLECLEAALTSETIIFGVWGGTTAAERKGKKYAGLRNRTTRQWTTAVPH